MGWQGEGEDGTNWQSRTDICTLHVSSVAKSCLILKPHERYPARRLCPWDFPGSILEWVAMPSSSGCSQPEDQTHLSYIGRQALYHWATRETQHIYILLLLHCFSRVWLCAAPETAAHQAPPSLGFSRQESWSGLPFPSLRYIRCHM